MVQIAGIALLDPVDHYVKEQLHVKYYIRYMDDFWMLLPTKEQAKKTYTETVEKIQAYGLQINEKKSHVVPLRKGFTFLGFQYRMTDTGKVIMTLNPDSVKHERKTLARMVHKSQRGELPPEKVEEHHNAWQNNAEKGNSNKVIERTRKYLKQLKGDEKNESKRMSQTPAEVTENENLKATVERQNQIIENQKVTIQYLAAMTDVYIPEEEEEEDVQNFAENEENV